MELRNFNNKPRRVGFEIEYIGIPIRESANLIHKLYGGKIVEKNENLIIVETPWGPFQLEVDVYLLEKLAAASKKNIEEKKIDVQGAAQYILSNLLTAFMPNEIVCPPIFAQDIEKLEPLIGNLREHGAKGTSASFAYAFGLHINVEPYSLETSMLLQYLRAFVLLYDYLKETMHIDITRAITLFAKPYSL
ncbi:MAG TPA: amidoligase family protein, partial [Gammaproteobacteria bacterium]|nr:amidoligase family protein [Gammaproteobacteria bacterium]